MGCGEKGFRLCTDFKGSAYVCKKSILESNPTGKKRKESHLLTLPTGKWGVNQARRFEKTEHAVRHVASGGPRKEVGGASKNQQKSPNKFFQTILLREESCSSKT